ncbi:MAG: hypothetical protein A3B41_01400 [Candidatus Levybacteria bacterium RIFCSPLOWO2_01_FULL_37_26]|nr:MAG: hypothetical protein A3E40_02920 [Candidatus Levybacteria bacterium RIFCSPHIGHO2_12_FULL_37_9]OGH39406.1 MAG: hypothetical protein A3B41_01400 [Candidatus Levybacteria bacterium RIFCSPLOWO2_01_FULL_37_26]
MAKEIARRIMATQWVQDRLKEGAIRDTLEDFTIESRRLSLKPEGKPLFDDFVNSIQKGKEIALSEYIDMFLGFDFKSGVNGLENLTALKNKPILLAANHVNYGPLGGDWQHAVISYYVKQTTGKEMKWLQGFDPTTTQDFFRERFYKSKNIIPVGDSSPRRAGILLLQAIKNKDSMGFYPEGERTKSLIQAIPDAGGLMLTCATRDIDIVCCSSGYKNDTFFLNFNTLDINQILEMGEGKKPKPSRLQEIVDYAMSTIAQDLPKNRRGYYGESQKANEPELTLTTPTTSSHC